MEIDAGNRRCPSRDSLSHWVEKHIMFFAVFHAFVVCAKDLGKRREIEALIVNRIMSSMQQPKGSVQKLLYLAFIQLGDTTGAKKEVKKVTCICNLEIYSRCSFRKRGNSKNKLEATNCVIYICQNICSRTV